MRGGDVVGAHGESGCRRSITDMGGVRWSLFCVRRIGEREVISLGFGWLIGSCGDSGVVIGSGVGGPDCLDGSCAGFSMRDQKSTP